MGSASDDLIFRPPRVTLRNRALKTLGRQGYRAVSAAVQKAFPPIGTAILRSSSLRRLMNSAYENRGPRFRYAFAVLMSKVAIRKEFEWRCGFGPKALRMPVIPAHPHSWNAALVWHWQGHAAIRRLYETYAAERPEGVLIDIGANDGTHTYPFAVRGYRCVAFEPQESCVDYIRSVASLNDLKNITVVRALVTDEAVAEAEYWTSESTWYSSRIREQTERFESAIPSRAPCISVDEYCRQGNLVPTLVKIDVEGWEAHVIRSAAITLSTSRPDLLVEVAAGSADRPEIWGLLKQYGYFCVRINHEGSAPSQEVASLEAFVERHGTFNDDFFFSVRRPRFLLE